MDLVWIWRIFYADKLGMMGYLDFSFLKLIQTLVCFWRNLPEKSGMIQLLQKPL